MGKSFTFTDIGYGSRSYFLTKINEGSNTVNTLKTVLKKSWYDTNTGVAILVAEKLIENVSTSTYPKYELTDWGKREAERFTEYENANAAVVRPALPEGRDTSGTGVHHEVPIYKDQESHKIIVAEIDKTELITKPHPIKQPDPGISPQDPAEPAAEEGKPNTESADLPGRPDPYAVAKFVADAKVCDRQHVTANDAYLVAYHDLLHEQFGEQISFKEVLARMTT